MIIVSPTIQSDYNNNLLMDIHKTSDGKDKHVMNIIGSHTPEYFIEKPLNPTTIKEIIHDIKCIIE